MIGFFRVVMANRRFRRAIVDPLRFGGWAGTQIALGTTAGAVAVIEFATLPAWASGAMLIGGAVLMANGLIPLAAGLLSQDVADRNTNLLGGSLATVGTIYAVIMGFVVVAVWESLSDAQTTVAREANAIADLEHMSRAFPVPVRRQVQEASRTYLRLVIEDEWPRMAQATYSERAHAAMSELWEVYTDMNVDEQTRPVYTQSLTRMNELGDNRRMRLLAAGDAVPSLMWLLVYLGGVTTIVLTYAFGVTRNWHSQLILWVLAGTVAFAVFLIKGMDRPFDTILQVGPGPFVFVVDNMQQLEQ